MNVLFLDYDGVVNTSMWNEDGTKCKIGSPIDNKVNNFQAVQWISEFCQNFGYDIVVTSTWRYGSNYKKCLINGGLRSGIRILGRTPVLPGASRGKEIRAWLLKHPKVDRFIIVDDDDDMGDLIDHLVRCDGYVGFTLRDYKNAEKMHKGGNTP